MFLYRKLKSYKLQNRALLYALILTKIFSVSIFFIYSAYIRAHPNCAVKYTKEFLPESPNDGEFSESNSDESYDIWVMIVRLSEDNTRMDTNKFKKFLVNVLRMSSVPISFHMIVDGSSRKLVLNEMTRYEVEHYKLYELDECKEKTRNISEVLMPYLSHKSHAYFNDGMFYISLGLHRIAPETQKRAIMLDCDLTFRKDVILLFDEFKKFKSGALLGMSRELSPIYHIFSKEYRKVHPDTTFGAYYHPNEILSESQPHPRGYQGFNSGVVLFNLDAIRQSEKYKSLFEGEAVKDLFQKYRFRGWYGDQDFYTLIGYEYPDLIQTLSCGFNRQLCRKLKSWTSYKDVFDLYFKCEKPVIIWHGNCQTKIPDRK